MCLILLGCWLGASLLRGQTPTVVEDFDRPFLFTYGSWQGRVAPDAEGIVAIRGVNNQGGAGYNVSRDLSAKTNASLILQARVGAGNQAAALRVLLRDEAGRNGIWDFPLSTKAERSLEALMPKDGASLSQPHSSDQGGPPDLGRIRQIQLMGDWAGEKAMEVEVDAVLVLAATPEIVALRKARREAIAEEEAEQRRLLAEARARSEHSPQGPWISAVGAAAPSILGLTIQAGEVKRFDSVPYAPEAGDRLAESKQQVLVWTNGVLREVPMDRVLVRRVNYLDRKVGFLTGGREGPPQFLPAEVLVGVPLETLTVDDPESYRISSPDDYRLREPVSPLAVYRKSKPNNQAQPNKELAVRHVIYLKLPIRLRDGYTYVVELSGLNTREESITYVHRSREMRCEAIHVNQAGYRPDDPYKRAFLSLWLGTGGATSFEEVERFLVLDDATGAPVFGGEVQRVLATDGTEKLRVEKNYSQTAVYALDFTQLRDPGRYRLSIPGLGCSDPFPIGEEVWREAFRTSMKGFLHQRSGIELGPPFTTYHRPRNLHPGDGVKVFASAVSLPESNVGGDEWFEALVDGRTDRVLTNAWGGYADAGDFDRRYQHLWATYLHLELLDCFPEYFAKLKLDLPADEAGNGLPDVLDEALWNVEFFHRLQDPDGGVRGGVESSAHPRAGETSWVESLAVMAFAADPTTSYLYAACAARAARLLEGIDAARSKILLTSAVRAWTWAEEHLTDFADAYGDKVRNEMRHACATAAVELYWITSDAVYHRAFEREHVLKGSRVVPVVEQQGAIFAYARLPDGRGVSVIKDQAREAILETADAAISFAEGNAFGLTTEIPQLPEIGPVGYFTVPGMISRSAPRAHFLSGDSKYLIAAIRSCNFSAGANPDNMSFTTGVGRRWPLQPLHIDSRMSRQAAPEGLTVYGASDPARNDASSAWVHTWVLRGVMVPESRTWPATEAYVDLYLWPMMNEFTVHQTLGPTSYTWGYLAAREAGDS